MMTPTAPRWTRPLARHAAHAGVAERVSLIRDRNGEVGFSYDQGSVQEILVGGQNLLRAFYLIGSCAGTDDEAQNVHSIGASGTLNAPGACPGAPFSFQCGRIDGRTLQVNISVGPLPADYVFLSAPMDCWTHLIQEFRFAAPGYVVGCGNSWSARTGTGGAYTLIPQPCTIPGHGSVGIARANRPEPWLEVIAPGLATIRRIRLAGNTRDGWFVRHPDTHNAERGWSVEGGPVLPRGSTYTLSEQIIVTPWGAAPAPTPSPIVFTTPPVVTALTAEAVTVAWQTSAPTTAVLRGWREADPGGAIEVPARSPWSYAGLTPLTRYRIEITARDAAGRTITAGVSFTTPGQTAPPPPPPPPPPPIEVEMKIRVDVPAWSKEVEISDQALVVEGTIPIRLTVIPVGTPPIDPPPVPIPGVHPKYRMQPFGGLGPINYWHLIDPVAFARALYEAGLTVTMIEWIPKGGSTITTYPDTAREFLAAMRRYTISTIIVAVNANGAMEMAQPDSWFGDILTEIKGVVGNTGAKFRNGRHHVLLEGVSEPGNAKADRWNATAASFWRTGGAVTVANGRSGGGAPVQPYDLGDHHHCSDITASTVKRGMLNNTDCGPVLNPGPQRAAAMTRVCLNAETHLLIFDLAGYPPGDGTKGKIDGPTIAAMGAEVQKGGPGTYLWDPALLGDGPVTPPPPPSGTGDDIDMSKVVWVRDWEAKVKSWPVTKRLDDVRFDGEWFDFSSNALDEDGWPESKSGSETGAPGNYVGFVQVDGVWMAGTFEWAPRGRDRVRLDRVASHNTHLGWHVAGGDGIAGGDGNKNPLEAKVLAHRPASGEMVGLMIASTCRNPSIETVNERTPIRLVRQP